jgi:3-deoxy-D-manno-octulosonic-acid transferase
VQYAQGQDGQFFVPVTVSAADLQAYQIRTPTSGVVMAAGSALQNPQQVAEDASRKRELRLLKNRQINKEAARECRRKKKEYIKCLENRVAVLENQNKALIEELKSLKELYCQKND